MTLGDRSFTTRLRTSSLGNPCRTGSHTNVATSKLALGSVASGPERRRRYTPSLVPAYRLPPAALAGTPSSPGGVRARTWTRRSPRPLLMAVQWIPSSALKNMPAPLVAAYSSPHPCSGYSAPMPGAAAGPAHCTTNALTGAFRARPPFIRRQLRPPSTLR